MMIVHHGWTVDGSEQHTLNCCTKGLENVVEQGDVVGQGAIWESTRECFLQGFKFLGLAARGRGGSARSALGCSGPQSTNHGVGTALPWVLGMLVVLRALHMATVQFRLLTLAPTLAVGVRTGLRVTPLMY